VELAPKLEYWHNSTTSEISKHSVRVFIFKICRIKQISGTQATYIVKINGHIKINNFAMITA